MKKYSFRNDYSEGAHSQIIKALSQHNKEQVDPYASDKFSQSAREKLKKLCDNAYADIHFVAGGTMANLLVISHLLRPYEAVISTVFGHIDVHETGAIEAVGHKILTCPSTDGKIRISDIEKVLQSHQDEHRVIPRLVYISQSTELGTIYSKSELQELYQFCHQNKLFLYIDGARIAQALTSPQSDLQLSDIASLCDVFYIGATKNGALFGEAILFQNDIHSRDFRYSMKQKGALIAKGRSLGIQFHTLFQEDLFFKLGKHANKMASKMAEALTEKNIPFYTPPQTNMLFPMVDDQQLEKLEAKFDFYVWSRTEEGKNILRLVTSWATPDEAIDDFVQLVGEL